MWENAGADRYKSSQITVNKRSRQIVLSKSLALETMIQNCLSWIMLFSIPDPGVKKSLDPGSGSATLFLSVVDPDWIRIQLDTGKPENFSSSSSFQKLDVLCGRMEVSPASFKVLHESKKNNPVAFFYQTIFIFQLQFFFFTHKHLGKDHDSEKIA